MNKSIADFVEEQVESEPQETLTPKAIGGFIRKYIYMNFVPTKQEKLNMYEALLQDIALFAEEGETEVVKKLITNIRNWGYARTHVNMEADQAEQTALENETFYNIRKL